MLLSFLGPHLPSLCSSESQLQIYVRLQAGRSNPELGCKHCRQLQACLAMVNWKLLYLCRVAQSMLTASCVT